jgi:hypothetical protein
MLDCQVAKKLSYLGKISPNQGTLVLDNIQSYTLSALENQTVQLKDDDDTVFFTGVTLKGKTSIDKKTVQLPIRDKWYSIRDTACTNKTWKDTSFKTIVEDIIDMTGETSYSVSDPSITVSWYTVTQDQKVRDVLEELANSIGAYCYYDASGILQFTAGFNASFSTSTAADYNNSMVSSVTIDDKTDDYDYSEVAFQEPVFKPNLEQVYNGASKDNSWLIGADGIGTSDEYRIKLDKPVYELDSYSNVTFAADAELTFDQTTYESNFQTGTQPKVDDSIKIKITNSAAITKEVTDFIINAKVIKLIEGVATYSSGNKLLSKRSEVIDSAVWAGKLAQYSYEQLTGVETIDINLAELDFTLDLADKFTYDSTRYVIDSISITTKSVRISGFKDRTAAFSYTSSSVRYTRDSEDMWFADGVAPSTPTGLSLSSTFADDTCFVKAQWNANTEDDMKGYELQWSYDNTTWYTIGVVVDTEKSFEVRPDKTVYVKIRATDIEGLESAWSSAVSVSTATGEETPEAPTSLSVNASPMTLELNWDCDTNTLFWRFEVQRSLASPVSYSTIANTKATQYVDLDVSASNTYIYRVRTVDIFENASAWVSATAGYTPEIAVTTDGTAPSTPTGLSLSSDYAHDKSYVTASWSANSESDIKGYSVRWSYDNATWRNAGMTAETSIGFEVRSNQTIYVQVRATDIEGYESSWSSSSSLTSTEDSNAPSTPSSITAQARVESIEVNWIMTPEYDLDYFKVERAVSPYTSYSEVAKVKGTSFVDLSVVGGTYYKYRVKAYDYSGNSSSYRTTTAGVTPGVYLGGDGIAPYPPFGLSLSSIQPTGEYKSVITASWNASTSIDVVKYIVEYKKQGVVWGDASTSETNGLSVEIEAEPLTWYDVRVKAVDVEEKSSGWITGSVKSANVVGDGLEPNDYGFVLSEAIVLNGKKYAHLVWEANGDDSNDIKYFHIRYFNATSVYQNYSQLVTPDTTGYDPLPSESITQTVQGDIREIYIEAEETFGMRSNRWDFYLFIEDYDGYIKHYPLGTPSSITSVFFSSISIDSVIPGMPSLTGDTSTSDTFNFKVTPPSNVVGSWTLEYQYCDVTETWGTVQSISGSKAYQWQSGTTYRITVLIDRSDKDRAFRCRARFRNNDDEFGDWSEELYSFIPSYASGIPGTPANVSVEFAVISTLKFLICSCDAALNASAYAWKITPAQNFTTIYHEGSSAVPEIYLPVDSFDSNYNYLAVRAENADGESDWVWKTTTL